MLEKEDIEKWAVTLTPIFVLLGVMWKKISRIEIKTDGLLEWRSRANIAEATLKEKDFVRDREDQREATHRAEVIEDRKQNKP